MIFEDKIGAKVILVCKPDTKSKGSHYGAFSNASKRLNSDHANVFW